MRWIITAGKVPATVSTIQAQADESQPAVGRWFAAQLDLKGIVTLVSVAVAVIGFAGSLVRNNAIREEQLKSQLTLSEVNKAELDRLKKEAAETVVPRKEYESNQRLLILLGQAQSGLCTRALPYDALPGTERK